MYRFRFPLVSICFVVALAGSLAAQEGERPEGWKVRFDRAGSPDSALFFVSMPPGYHITTGPSGILYDPSQTARGAYRVESEIHLFDPSGRREAFGIFFGGQDLEGPDQSYTYFLIRNGGQFLVKRRAGSRTEDIRPWTAHEGIVSWDGSAETAKNVLAVDIGTDTVTFFVNGEAVTSLSRSEVGTDGVVGLRVNHGLNVHVARLDVTSSQ